MFRRQNILLLRHRHMRINLRHIDGAMPQHLLNIADIHICVQQAGRKGVAEHMRCNVLLNGGKGGVLIDHSAHGLIGKGVSAVVNKEMLTGCPFIANTFVVGCQNMNNRLTANLQAPFPAPLSVDENDPVRQIHVAYF